MMSPNKVVAKQSGMTVSSSSSYPFRFFKIILIPSVLDHPMLRIPDTFTKKFGEQLSTVATLIIPSGIACEVEVVRRENKLYFAQGWPQFMESNQIKHGYFLEFEYLENGRFNVRIFDLSCCEIEYQMHVEVEVEVEVEVDEEAASFSIVVRPYHTNYLHIPKWFVEQHMRDHTLNKEVKLQVMGDTREWSVPCARVQQCFRLTGVEWTKFTKDNKWRRRQVYTFKIAKEDSHSLVFQVLRSSRSHESV